VSKASGGGPKGAGSFKDVLPDLLKGLSVTPANFSLLAVVEKTLAGISPQAEVVGFKNNRIYVEVQSSVHLSEVSFRKGEILKAVRDAFPGQPLPELKFFLKGTAKPTRQEWMQGQGPGRTGASRPGFNKPRGA
jgi:hypothetical protein